MHINILEDRFHGKNKQEPMGCQTEVLNGGSFSVPMEKCSLFFVLNSDGLKRKHIHLLTLVINFSAPQNLVSSGSVLDESCMSQDGASLKYILEPDGTEL